MFILTKLVQSFERSCGVFEKAIVKAWTGVREGLISASKSAAKVRAAPPRRAAEHLRYANSAIHVADESHGLPNATAAVDDRAPHPNPAAPAAALPKRTKKINPADGFLKDVYGDRYNTNGSSLARTYARSLVRVPEEFHRRVAAYMKKAPHGGIWLGDGSLLELDHPGWSEETRGGAPEGWPEGTTWNDVGGAYDVKHRALLAGSPHEQDIALHEFGHAVDHTFGMPSQAHAFAEVHAKVVSLISHQYVETTAYFTQRGGVGEEELFAHGFGWFHENQQPSFFGSAAAAHHMRDYYQALTSRIVNPS